MINNESLSLLRASVKGKLSEKRFAHVLGVEKAAAKIGEFCLPEKILQLRAAALLHDVTKELSQDEHIEILKRNSFSPTADLLSNPHLLHSFSAPYAVSERYSEFATAEVLSAVEKHTLGAENMSVFDEIIFISDYVEDGRTYDSCVTARSFLFDSLNPGDVESNLSALHRACIMSIDFTVEALEKKKRFVHPRILLAKQYLTTLI